MPCSSKHFAVDVSLASDSGEVLTAIVTLSLSENHHVKTVRHELPRTVASAARTNVYHTALNGLAVRLL